MVALGFIYNFIFIYNFSSAVLVGLLRFKMERFVLTVLIHDISGSSDYVPCRHRSQANIQLCSLILYYSVMTEICVMFCSQFLC